MKRLLLVAVLVLGGAASADARVEGGSPVALVTAETQNRLIAVALPSGRVLRRLPMPADPENVETNARVAVVVSPRAGAVTIVDLRHLRVRKILRGFGSPHIVALDPTGAIAYVTDDARGQLDVIDLGRGTVIRRVAVGPGAHHIALHPDSERMWIALGERARTIVVLDTLHPKRPRVIASFHPAFGAHDLAFSPDGNRVWVTSDADPYVHVLSARTGRELSRIYGGSAPQHVAFGIHDAYITSGNDSALRFVDPRTGRTVRTVRTTYGSFNVGLGGPLLLTSSLYRGTLTELDERGRVLLATHVAPAARDVAVGVLP